MPISKACFRKMGVQWSTTRTTVNYVTTFGLDQTALPRVGHVWVKRSQHLCLFQPTLTAKYSMPLQRRVRVSHPIRKPITRAFCPPLRIIPILVCAIAKSGQSLGYFCLHCFVCFACFDCFKGGLARACPEHHQRTRKRRGHTLGPGRCLLRFGAVKTQPRGRGDCAWWRIWVREDCVSPYSHP